MTDTFKVACVQNCAEDDLAENIAIATQLTRDAAGTGAELICLPENFTCLEERDEHYLTRGFDAASHPALPHFRELAQSLGVYLVLGSLTIKTSPERVANRSYLITPDGALLREYDKIHLFDVRLKNGEMYKESNAVAPGNCAVIAELPWGRLGLSICYDVRFPQLYRLLAQAGADFIAIPAAFTHTTGMAHWHVLVRARAIETGCFVFAAGQCGTRSWGRKTYGHSLIVDPWGEVLADGGSEPGFIMADIAPSRVAEVRAMIPALLHDREIAPPG
ncbi:MAG: carbon-nitrogen hydrolase family protein [Gammaproteobacteria bacterium]|nr:carbon-nitrogen hydrolase family protein [Gammaproteobacteria bacterium]